MMGLIWKDFLVIKKTLLYMLVVAILFGGVYTSMDSNYFLTFFLSIIVSIAASRATYIFIQVSFCFIKNSPL